VAFRPNLNLFFARGNCFQDPVTLKRLPILSYHSGKAPRLGKICSYYGQYVYNKALLHTGVYTLNYVELRLSCLPILSYHSGKARRLGKICSYYGRPPLAAGSHPKALVRGGSRREPKGEEEATTRLPHQESQPAWDRRGRCRQPRKSTPGGETPPPDDGRHQLHDIKRIMLVITNKLCIKPIGRRENPTKNPLEVSARFYWWGSVFDLVPRCFSAAYELDVVSGRLLLVQQYAAWRTLLLLPLPCTAVAVGFTVGATVCRYPVHG
jgi:hypothetical protein